MLVAWNGNEGNSGVSLVKRHELTFSLSRVVSFGSGTDVGVGRL